MAISTRLSFRLLLRFLLVSSAQRLSGYTPLGKSGDVLNTAREGLLHSLEQERS